MGLAVALRGIGALLVVVFGRFLTIWMMKGYAGGLVHTMDRTFACRPASLGFRPLAMMQVSASLSLWVPVPMGLEHMTDR